MSSNYHRISRVDRRIVRLIYSIINSFTVLLHVEDRHAAVNSRRQMNDRLGSPVGGEIAERHDTAAGADRGGIVASASRRGVGAVVRRRVGVLLAADKVQVKYEMLRAHVVDGLPVSEVAAVHGYSRAAFYLVVAGFERLGMAGLLDERRGRRGPVKLRPEILDFIRATTGSGTQIAEQVADRFGVVLHRRTVERVRGR